MQNKVLGGGGIGGALMSWPATWPLLLQLSQQIQDHPYSRAVWTGTVTCAVWGLQPKNRGNGASTCTFSTANCPPFQSVGLDSVARELGQGKRVWH